MASGTAAAATDDGRVRWRRALPPLGMGIWWPTSSFAYRRAGKSTLTTMRTIWLAVLLGSIELSAVVLLAFGEGLPGEVPVGWYAATVLSAVALLLIRRLVRDWMARRATSVVPLVDDDPAPIENVIVTSVEGPFYLGLLMSVVPFGVGLYGAASRLTYSPSLIAVGLCTSVTMIVLRAPTDAAIRRWQHRVVPITIPVDLAIALRRIVDEPG